MRMHRRRAVFRQPHHLHGQHHDPRQRHPPRDAPRRRRVFNTEALKYSVRRLNQLGYFKTLEERQRVDVQKTPSEKNQVDVTLKLEEQNRNQLTFGAGVSQFEGFFGQLSFQTSNFLGRGEIAHAVDAGRSPRAELPGRLHRAVPVRPQHHRRRRRLPAQRCSYVNQFTQKSTGGNITVRLSAGGLLAAVPDLQLRGSRSPTSARRSSTHVLLQPIGLP